MKPRINIVDYGIGNIMSLSQAFRHIGCHVNVGDESNMLEYDLVVLPGVGAFGAAMEKMTTEGIIKKIKEYHAKGKLILGICLGMQLLFSYSEEHSSFLGLDLIKGSVKRIENKTSRHKVPHMGWKHVIFDENSLSKDYYFAHSYQVFPDALDIVTAKYSSYGSEIPAAIKKENLIGFQFHPEKSGVSGLELLKSVTQEAIAVEIN